jgi:Flp pilus assembly protein TadG
MKSKFKFLSLLSRLGKYKHLSGPQLLARLLRDEDGSYLLYMTLATPIFIGLSAFATEGTLLLYNHRAVQGAADAAAYSAAIAYSINSSADITTQAQAIVASYGFVVGTANEQANVVATVDTTTYSPNAAIGVTVTRSQVPILSHIWVNNPFSVSGSATALIGGGSGGTCLLALGKQTVGGVTTTDLSDAIHVQGNAGLNMPGCGVFSNSTDCTANGGLSIDVLGNAAINAGWVGTAGCISETGNASITPAYTQHDAAISDPYAGVSIPTAGSSGSCNSGSCSPGVYSTDPGLKGGTWTLQPGVYVFQQGFTVGPGGGGTTVTGNGVTLVFTNTGFNFDSNANVSLTAPTSGGTAGFVVMGATTMPLNTSFYIDANANADLNGTIYLPNGSMNWQGTADSTVSCRQFIVNSISLQGDPKLGSASCNLTTGQKPIGNDVTLVK